MLKAINRGDGASALAASIASRKVQPPGLGVQAPIAGIEIGGRINDISFQFKRTDIDRFPCGRETPRWSVEGAPKSSPASIAGLPGSSAAVSVDTAIIGREVKAGVDSGQRWCLPGRRLFR